MIEDVWVCTYAGKLLSGPFSDLETMILTAARRSAFPQRWGVFCYGWGVDSCRRRRRRSVFDGQWSMVNGQPISGVVSLKHLFGRLALVDVKSHVQRARLLSA
jgi:hypothetical protein